MSFEQLLVAVPIICLQKFEEHVLRQTTGLLKNVVDLVLHTWLYLRFWQEHERIHH